ncbi:MAG: sigma-70 family RNA polymerase sigma factor [Pseudomonadota bacterium]
MTSTAYETPKPPEHRANMAELVVAIAARQCRNSFAELFAYYAPRLKSYMMRLGSDSSQAEELSQEVMVTVWRKAVQYDPDKASVSTWIFRIARNRRIDAHRRLSRPDLEPDEPMLRPEEPEQPDDIVNRAQVEGVVRTALETLPAEQLVLLQAAFYDGLSHSEIADRFDLPLGTVKSRIRLAFNKLRGQLQSDP